MSEANESSTASEANESSTASEANESSTASEANESSATGSDDATAEPTPEPAPALLRVVKGEPTAEELAAVVAVVAARNAAAAAAAAGCTARPRSEWGHPARAHRTPHRVGPDQWRRSSWA
ncbi:acyl-CoA carboxylase subunit epsilon [Aeromicrobium sp. CF4.19]|uniref:acyl-CoA carboxylase subunit epsilon n=1 Tax=Aeromicrobium sp. CF4.19 TaxID=3373082 RepID=UPI003EE438A1